MSDAPRTRFAPSPTGSLHVGSARTALFNYLFARRHGGAFLLRIEDTDVARSREEWIEGIQFDLRWLGIEWDGEPTLQSTRFDRYRAAVHELLGAGLAYEAFETPEELEAINEERRRANLPPGYDGRARDLSAADRERLAAEGRPRAVRFRTPDDGHSRFEDRIRGEVSVEWSTIADFVILRSDHTPTFFLANAVDDLEMGITHVLRGEDLIDSTHRVLALRRALGDDVQPVYAHMPLILSADRSKLSKRHGAVALDEFRDGGILPESMVNYLALLGWSPHDGREVLSLAEMADAFDLDRVGHTAAVFDHQKLEWLNGEHIRALTVSELEGRVVPLARDRFRHHLDVDVLHEAVAIGQERASTLVALVEQMDFLFCDDDEFEIAAESWERLVATDRVDEVLAAADTHLASCEWAVAAIDLRPVLGALDVKPRKAMPALYAAIEGRHAGLPLFDSIALLGRARARSRLLRARERLASP
ncbi:MAG: glutamate--tRNA ligase [Acidimicrobiia bacterium]